MGLIQEVDIDSEAPEGERTFLDSRSVGFQLMAGIDQDITNNIYLTGELHYTSFTDQDLEEEGG